MWCYKFATFNTAKPMQYSIKNAVANFALTMKCLHTLLPCTPWQLWQM